MREGSVVVTSSCGGIGIEFLVLKTTGWNGIRELAGVGRGTEFLVPPLNQNRCWQ